MVRNDGVGVGRLAHPRIGSAKSVGISSCLSPEPQTAGLLRGERQAGRGKSLRVLLRSPILKPCSGALAHRLPERGISSERPQPRVEALHIAGTDDVARESVANQVPGGAARGGHDGWYSTRKGFVHHQAKRLVG